jgi:polyisoprenoid-binding protein YceI
MNAPVIATEELRRLLQSQKDIVLLNVLPEKFFKQKHIPGSVNVDGYKMDFIDEVEKAGIKKDAAIVVYASGSDSEASSYAAERMLKQGWMNVRDYREGIAGWTKFGFALEEEAPARPSTGAKTDYVVDTAQSLVLWSGRNMNSIHTGTLKIKEGRIERGANDSIKGTIVLDMNSIADTDLTDPAWNKMLVTHLKSGDFFETALYPTAKTTIKHSRRMAEDGCGNPNFTLTADVSIKDVTREITFPASIVVEEDGTLKAHAHFDFDRTLWNVKYGSWKFFKLLGRHLVDDVISLNLKLVAQ